MRLTILSILTTCLFPCLVDSTYGQGGEQHNIYDPGQALWNRLADEFHGNDYNTTHVDEYGTISMTFMVEESHTGGAKPNGAVELHDRAADHNSTRSNRAASVGSMRPISPLRSMPRASVGTLGDRTTRRSSTTLRTGSTTCSRTEAFSPPLG